MFQPKDKNFADELRALKLKDEKHDRRTDRPANLKLASIEVAEAVFQPRTIFGSMGVDEAHIKELVRAAKVQLGQDKFLDPVLVMPIGKDFYCVDGHHRLGAYRELEVSLPIPVEHFEGSIKEGVEEAIRRNSRDKLSMSKKDKLESAWKLTAQGGLSKAQISGIAGVAVSTVGSMRTVMRHIIKANASYEENSLDSLPPGPIDLTWAEARRYGQKPTDYDEDWKERQAIVWAKRLAKAFGKKWGMQPEVAAMAIEMYSEGLPEQLIEEWRDKVEDLKEVHEDEW